MFAVTQVIVMLPVQDDQPPSSESGPLLTSSKIKTGIKIVLHLQESPPELKQKSDKNSSWSLERKLQGRK